MKENPQKYEVKKAITGDWAESKVVITEISLLKIQLKD